MIFKGKGFTVADLLIVVIIISMAWFIFLKPKHSDKKNTISFNPIVMKVI